MKNILMLLIILMATQLCSQEIYNIDYIEYENKDYTNRYKFEGEVCGVMTIYNDSLHLITYKNFGNPIEKLEDYSFTIYKKYDRNNFSYYKLPNTDIRIKFSIYYGFAIFRYRSIQIRYHLK